MKVHARVDKDSGLIDSVVVTAANVHDLTPAAELLHGDEEIVYGDAVYQNIAKRPEMAGMTNGFRVGGHAARQTQGPIGSTRGKAAGSDREGQSSHPLQG